MTATPNREQGRPEAPDCLVRSVSHALADEAALEAVTIERGQKSISIATLGPADHARLEKRVAEAVDQGQQVSAHHECSLLEGCGDCQSCNIPLQLSERSGITVRQQPETTTIARVTCPTAPSFWRWRKIAWPRIVPRELLLPEAEEEFDEWKYQLGAAGFCGLFGLSAALAGSGSVAMLLFLLAYLAGGWFAAVEVRERLHRRQLDVHFLMLAVAAGSASIGAWHEGTTLLFLFSLSGALEHYAMGRTQREIRSLFRSAPKTATLLEDGGQEREGPVDQLRPGQHLLIKPGAQFPVDGEIVRGETAGDESNLTGEATPVRKRVGDSVLAGTLNLWGAVEVLVLRPAKESALEKVIDLIREAQTQKAPSQRLTDKFGTSYTYAVLVGTVLMFFVWWLGFGHPAFLSHTAGKSAFYLAMTLLVVSSPCALVLSIPSAVLAAIAWGARRGILFRGGAAVEKLAEVEVVALDKTGTLTTGDLAVERVESFPPGREGQVLQLAYSLEKLSSHPLARAITRAGKRRGLAPLPLTQFESVTGCGAQALWDGQICRLGRRDWLRDQLPPGLLDRSLPTDPGFSEVCLACGELVGRLLLRDDIRPAAGAVVAGLRAAGLRSVVLTGDRASTAHQLKAMLGLEDVRAELKPEQKLQIIRELTAQGQLVAMVGDGINDAPSLAAAHVGIAMGARGADAALEQADVVLMHDRLENVQSAYELSRRARRVIQQNLLLSLGSVIVLVALAAAGAIPLTLGVIGHEGSTVMVVMNSLRLLLSGPPRRALNVQRPTLNAQRAQVHGEGG